MEKMKPEVREKIVRKRDSFVTKLKMLDDDAAKVERKKAQFRQYLSEVEALLKADDEAGK
jgi:hypothetical protein